MKLTTVKLHDDIIEIVDDKVSVKRLCENLGLDVAFQRKKIQADESFESEFKEIEINGIIQKVLCIPYEKVNGWLFSISVNRVKPEVKQKLIEYKKECFDVLYRHFNQTQSVTPTQLDLITPYEVRRDLTTARRILTIEKKKHRATAEFYEEKLKNIVPQEDFNKLETEHKELQNKLLFAQKTLIEFSNRYHTVVLESDNKIKAIKNELERMTNVFQLIPDLKNSGNNLNTETVAGHSYWN